jgi:hypothetical protein
MTIHESEYGETLRIVDGRLFYTQEPGDAGHEFYFPDDAGTGVSKAMLSCTETRRGLNGERIRYFRIYRSNVRLRHVRCGDDQWWDVVDAPESRP